MNVVATSAVVLCVVCLADVKLTYKFLNAKCQQCHPPRVVLVLILACQVSNVFLRYSQMQMGLLSFPVFKS